MKKTVIHLKDLVTKGQFGPLKTGMTMEEVKALIEEPHSSDKGINNDFMIYAYDSFEVFFNNFMSEETDDYTVHAFQNDQFHYDHGFDFHNSRVSIKPWILKQGLAINKAKQLISQEGLLFGVTKRHDFTSIIFETGASIDFLPSDWEEEGLKEPLLSAIGYFLFP